MKPLVSTLLLILAAGCSAPSADLIPRYGTFDVEGHFGITSNAANPVPVADMETAGFDRDDGYLGLRADINVGSPTYFISAQSTSHGGSGNLLNQLSSGGSVINPGPVSTKMDIALYQLGVTFDFVPSDLVDVGLGLGINTVDLDAEVANGGSAIDVDRTLPIPVIALRAGIDLGDFEASALVTGLEIDVSGDEVSYFDLDVLARYRLIGGDDHLAGSIALGYRLVELGVEYEDDGDRIDTEFRFDGPYLAFILSL